MSHFRKHKSNEGNWVTKLKIGVVGAGLIGQVEHIPNLLRLSQYFELTGVVDASPMMRAELKSRGFTAYSTYQQLLDSEIDAILVAAPDQYHAEITLAALQRGKHVFCEKPLCFSVVEAEIIAAARQAAGRVVQVGYMKRFDPSYELLLSLLPKMRPDSGRSASRCRTRTHGLSISTRGIFSRPMMFPQN